MEVFVVAVFDRLFSITRAVIQDNGMTHRKEVKVDDSREFLCYKKPFE
jgi:hypothetical protein